MKKYANIPVLSLVIFAIPHAQPKWMSDSTDAKVREAAKADSAEVEEADVLRETKSILSALK